MKKQLSLTRRLALRGMLLLALLGLPLPATLHAATTDDTETSSTTTTTLTVDSSTGAFTKGNKTTVATSTCFSTWQSTSTTPQLTISASANNMVYDDTNIAFFTGSGKTCTYTLSVTSGYVITGISFNAKIYSSNTAATVTVGNQSCTATSDGSSLSATNLYAQTQSIVVSASSTAWATLADFTVTVKESSRADYYTYRGFTYTDLFTTNASQTVPYRIPAIAKAHDGSLIAFSDYRPCGSDIGYGEVDIVARRSTDNGATWDNEFKIADGTGTSGATDCGYGDAAVVADRESDNVLLICVCGNIPVGSSTRTKPMPIARFRSSNNGATWTSATEITEKIYSIFDESSNGKIKSLFFGSGRICQSSIVKVGDYYRLYAALYAKDENNVEGNRVIYSDDFGETWQALGGINALPCPGGNEPKCEELPDGTVVLSSRKAYGRYFNLFTYTDVKEGTGTWSTAVNVTNAATQPKDGSSLGTNGEILILPANRNSDDKEVYVALQSIPMGNRTNVGIYYKELSSLADVKDPTAFASNWDGYYQVSNTNSAYSTMILQANDSIAFFFEEEKYGNGYTNVYMQFNLERITNGAYSYKSDVNRIKFVRSILEERTATVTPTIGTALGMYTPASGVAISQASANAASTVLGIYDAKPTAQGYADALTALANASSADAVTNQPKEGVEYVITSNRLSGYRMALSSTTTSTDTTDEDGNTTTTTTTSYSYVKSNSDVDDTQKFQLESAGDGVWYIKNSALGVYMCSSPTYSQQFTGTTDKSSAGTFTITSTTNGISVISSTSPATSNYGCLNVNSNQTGVVAWTANDEGSKWIITPYESTDDATARTALVTAITTAMSYEIGAGLGQFTATDTYTSTLNTATADAIDYEKTADDLTTDATSLTTALSALTLNLPTAGMFLRIRATSENRSDQPCLLPYNADSSVKENRAALGTDKETDIETIFYYTGQYLLSYYNGFYLALTGTQAYFNGVTSGTTVTFEPATVAGTQINDYYVYYGNTRYLYTNLSSGAYFSDAWDKSQNASIPVYCNYELEEVTSLPVTVSAVGYATLYAPVDLTIPDGVKAYTGVVVTTDDGKYLQLTEVKNTLSANTPVVLEATAGTYYFTVSGVPTSLSTATSGTSTDVLAGNVATFAKTVGDLTLQYIDDEIGFYTFTGTNIPGFKSYIEFTKASNVQGLKFADSATAIDHVTTEPTVPADAVYDLQGRRVTNPGRGFYIIGGKKVFRL